ncbi:nuclear mRNA splicing factor-associated protein [Dendryphion nanum]|uniref:Nuclear mRNA splicing factor-associated protein n=1 Tax=Dendryphion nanum TaxID=256645 RepID=A0A9P9ITS2_9PLEO|nr:nuclear mRNA splicing factor-associated protein [Dendryphion nanum]
MASSTPKPFPKDPETFLQDDRIGYSRADDKYLLWEDNKEWEWNPQTEGWFLPATEDEVAAFQQAYGGPANDDDEAEAGAASAQANKKRKNAKDPEANNKKTRVQENRAVYVSNLPLDTKLEEIETEFSKYGVIDQGVDGSKRIKMYADEDGNFKGEALVIYFKKASVAMAINMADDYWFRPGDTQKISVKEADMSYKRHQDGKEVKLVRKDKKANERNRAELNRKLADWSDDDDVSKEAFAPPTNKWNKYVIIKKAFTLEELDEDPVVLAEIKEDILSEAEKFGDVTKVVLYDKEPEGIVSVRFKEIKDAEAFKDKTHGRLFGQVLEAYLADDRPKFKKSGKVVESDDEEEAQQSEKVVSQPAPAS